MANMDFSLTVQRLIRRPFPLNSQVGKRPLIITLSPNHLEEAVAMMMHDELDGSRLEVYLVPCFGAYGDDGRYRRVAVERNPDWYRRLCNQYQSQRARPRRRRHGDTMIKRQWTLAALRRIAQGEVDTVYARRVYPFVQERAAGMLAARVSEGHYEYITIN